MHSYNFIFFIFLFQINKKDIFQFQSLKRKIIITFFFSLIMLSITLVNIMHKKMEPKRVVEGCGYERTCHVTQAQNFWAWEPLLLKTLESNNFGPIKPTSQFAGKPVLLQYLFFPLKFFSIFLIKLLVDTVFLFKVNL